MRQRDENFLAMTAVALRVLETYKKDWQGNAPVADAVAAISGAVADLEAARRGAGAAVSTGATRDKEALMAAAIDDAVKLSGFAQVYATRLGNLTLLEQLKAVKRKRLEDMDDGGLVPALEDVHARLAALGKGAEPYGVTPARLSAFKAAIEAYKPLKEAPRLVIVTRKGQHSTEPALLALIRREWKLLDLLLPGLWEGVPALGRDYRNARVIVDRGGGREVKEE